MTLVETAAEEVGELHAFFEAWFRGELPRANDGLERLEATLGDDFHLLGPGGSVRSREAVIDGVDGGHGANRGDDPPFRIEVEAVEPRFERGDVCRLTYEEHQRTEGQWRARRSSALFERATAAPGGVVWRHLHETWLDA